MFLSRACTEHGMMVVSLTSQIEAIDEQVVTAATYLYKNNHWGKNG